MGAVDHSEPLRRCAARKDGVALRRCHGLGKREHRASTDERGSRAHLIGGQEVESADLVVRPPPTPVGRGACQEVAERDDVVL